MLKNPIIAFLKLIRIENLLIIVLTQCCIQYVVLDDLIKFTHFNHFLFSMSLLSTVLIAAAGYIINDYFDVKTDKINRPNTVVLDVVIKRRWAMVLHIAFNSLGLLLGIYLALKCHHLKLALFQLSSILLLWFYSTHFKKQLLVGNIVVSCLTATIPLMPLFYNYYYTPEISSMLLQTSGGAIKLAFYGVIGYSLFAFLTSLAREVIKDMEDFNGDAQTGCKTMPIVWGIVTSKVFVFFVIIITIGMLLLVSLYFLKLHALFSFYYILVLTVVPLLAIIFMIIKAKSNKDFKLVSILLKFVMLFGIAFTYFI